MKKYETCWVEIRDAALVIYNPKSAPDEDTEYKSTGEIGVEISKMASCDEIDVLPLREAKIGGNDRKNIITVRNADRTSTTDVRFPNEVLYSQWGAVLRECTGLRLVTLADFQIEKHVGKGASGRVYLVRERSSQEQLALKVIEKSYVYESDDSYRHALDERIVHELASRHPFILSMRYAFQNRERLFLVTEYCQGGDLFEYLSKKCKPMEERKAKIIAAELLMAIEHIHNLGIVYRDIKPENVLLDENGHVRLADFGLTKRLRQKDGQLGRTNTFCGTREYIAPEMLAGDSYDFSVDYWAFGIIIYEMLCERTPFYCSDREKIYDRIKSSEVSFPEHLSPEVHDLLKKLLVKDPAQRFGHKNGAKDIKSHAWFREIEWSRVNLMWRPEHSIVHELTIMNCGSMGRNLAQRRPSNRRRERQEKKALTVLENDAEADTRAVEQSSPVTFNSTATPKNAKGGPAFVVPVTKARKSRPMIAGYSFSGRDQLSQTRILENFHLKARTRIEPRTGAAETQTEREFNSIDLEGLVQPISVRDIREKHSPMRHAASAVPVLSDLLSASKESMSSDLDDIVDRHVETARL